MKICYVTLSGQRVDYDHSFVTLIVTSIDGSTRAISSMLNVSTTGGSVKQQETLRCNKFKVRFHYVKSTQE